MIRKYVTQFHRSQKDVIAWRSHEPKRIEAFSDGVFAFAVSLSVISLEVPHTFRELLDMLRGFMPFMLCYAGLFKVWMVQYKFFRRFGLNDNVTVTLNGALLLVVLFFIYPLKFLFSSLYLPEKYIVQNDEMITVFMLYGAGITAVYVLFTLMYLNAWFQRDELRLNEMEIYETKTFIYLNGSQLFTIGITLGFMYHASRSAGKNFLPSFIMLFVFMFLATILNRKRKRDFRKRFGDVSESALMQNPEQG